MAYKPEIPVKVWEEKSSNAPFIPDIDDVLRLDPDDKQLRNIKNRLIHGKVALSINQKTDEIKISGIRVDIWYPLPNENNLHSSLFNITVTHSELPIVFKTFTPAIPVSVGNDFSYHNCIIGVSRKIPNTDIRLMCYPYNFYYLRKHLNLEGLKPVWVKWNFEVI